MKKILLFSSLLGFFCVTAQDTDYNTYQYDISLASTIDFSEIQEDWNAYVYSVESPFPGANSARNYLHQLKLLQKDIPLQNKVLKSVQKSSNLSPSLLQSFEGNPYGGIPNDNDLAISNAGVIVSVTNSAMYVFDESGVLLGDVSLYYFSDSIGLTANSYDPKVMYDPKEDKFILVFLNGNDSQNSDIVVCFSTSNNPLGDWNMYSLEGNPLNNNAWSDFPAIAMTDDDFYITVNHINSDSVSWQTGFMQSVIWHLEKEGGYAGDGLDAQLYTDILYKGKPLRNLTPIKGGATTYGPDMYLLSNRNFDAVNDTFFLVHINDRVANVSNIDIETDYFVANIPYQVPPHVYQPQNFHYLQTNDARPLGGFYQNGAIHFVGNTANPANGLGAIYHGRVDIQNFDHTATMSIIAGEDSLEYGYPNISFTGIEPCDEQAIINFNHSSVDSFPGVSAIYYHIDSGYSERVHIKSGESYVSLINGEYERWGDYTGSQRRYNKPGEVWFNGFYGIYEPTAGPGAKRRHHTWIASLSSTFQKDCNVGILHTEKNVLKNTKIYPNPFRDLMFFEFNNPKTQYLTFEIYDIDGKLIKRLLYDKIKEGINVLTFSTQPMSKGVYIMTIKSEEGHILASENIIQE